MKKNAFIYLFIVSLILASCATKSYVRLEDERIYKQSGSLDSLLAIELKEQNSIQDYKQDSLYTTLSLETDSLFLDLMGEIYYKGYEIDSLQSILNDQGKHMKALVADIDTLQVLRTQFKDADYTMIDLSRIKSNLDSLMINQKHLSRELQYMIRDLNLIERNLMDIMNYSINSMKSKLQTSNMMMERSFYKNNATAYKMIMIYLMSNSSSDPDELLSYIDSVYSLGPALDTIKVTY